MPITISIYDEEVAERVKQSVPAGISIAESHRMVRSAEFDHIVILTLTFIKDAARDLDIGLFATWLCKLAKDKSCHVSKGREKIPDTEVAVRRWIQEELDI
jgi:hypothetical protein